MMSLVVVSLCSWQAFFASQNHAVSLCLEGPSYSNSNSLSVTPSLVAFVRVRPSWLPQLAVAEKSLEFCFQLEAVPIVLTVPSWFEEPLSVLTGSFSSWVELLKVTYDLKVSSSMLSASSSVSISSPAPASIVNGRKFN